MNTNITLRHTCMLLALGLTIGACQDSDIGRQDYPGWGESGDMEESGDDGWDDDDDADQDDDDGDDHDDDSSDDSSDDSDGPAPACGDGVVDVELGEQCDDDNVDELDGCLADCRLGPTALQVNYEVSTPLEERGGGGGGVFDDECPEGEVIIGVVGRAGAYVDQVQFQCGTIGLSSDEPGSILVSLEPGTMQEPHGGGGGNMFAISCQPGQAVVGFGGRSGKYLDRLSLRCAPVMLVDDPETGAPSIAFGGTVDTEFAGGGGGSAFTLDCPSGEIATLARGRSGVHVDALGLTCRPLELI